MDRRYHRGEIAVQERAGATGRAAHSERAIGTTVPAVATAFLAAQPMVVVGGTDDAGQVWATVLTGEPGFLRAVGDTEVTVAARPGPDDPLAAVLADTSGVGARVGMIAIEPGTRRRMRMNGTAYAVGRGLRVDLDQVYANCPKYISKRAPAAAPGDLTGGAGAGAVRGTELTARQRAAITSTDTFFVATADDEGNTDASHRGGNPGFVHVPASDRIVWPDYAGNSMFMTAGNLAVNPAAGLVFPDWSAGGLLHVTGTARTIWDDAERIAAHPGAERLMELTVTGVVEVAGATGLVWSAPEYSRHSPELA
ncbi:pyridoxamine 5'-phosphate oxidase family protein [Yinghuangia sp. YIM S09857]|uniref:pyridoxamine 5'-phosphate oxidase family protein n=1 Tax=Yinghuangia sp. YIM S09857 TaxID=3436929 RepID=UPI003F532340